MNLLQKSLKVISGHPGLRTEQARESSSCSALPPPAPVQAKGRLGTGRVGSIEFWRRPFFSRCLITGKRILKGKNAGDLTAKWREVHMKELLAEMEVQAKALEMHS
jgi:hypothetical protein